MKPRPPGRPGGVGPGPRAAAAAPRHPLAFEPLLFLQPAHQALQPPAAPVLSFYLEDGAPYRGPAARRGRPRHRP
ncbi:hypothetical protein, partial [Hymenobacter coccineus]|uniref:hypothetical protein n=1 Tax=Hymenobacter coccineus TaxID=1908235 RepID=UPI001955F4A2